MAVYLQTTPTPFTLKQMGLGYLLREGELLNWANKYNKLKIFVKKFGVITFDGHQRGKKEDFVCVPAT